MTYTKFGVEVNIYLQWEWEGAHVLKEIYSLTFIYVKVILSLTMTQPCLRGRYMVAENLCSPVDSMDFNPSQNTSRYMIQVLKLPQHILSHFFNLQLRNWFIKIVVNMNNAQTVLAMVPGTDATNLSFRCYWYYQRLMPTSCSPLWDLPTRGLPTRGPTPIFMGCLPECLSTKHLVCFHHCGSRFGIPHQFFSGDLFLPVYQKPPPPPHLPETKHQKIAT